MTVAIDSQEASNVAHRSATSPLTWTFNNGSGTLLIVGVVVTQNLASGALTITATYNGVAMTVGATLNNWNAFANDYVLLFYLVNPATGSNMVSVSSSAAVFDIIGAAISFTGVNLASPVSSGFNASGSGGTSSVNVSGTANGDYVVSAAGTGTGFLGATAPTVTSASLNVSGNTASDNFVLGQQATAGGTVAAGFSETSDVWGIVALKILQSLTPPVVNLPPAVPPLQHYVEDWYAVQRT